MYDDGFITCYLCGQRVTYEDDVTIDESGLEHECPGSEEIEEENESTDY